MILDGHRIIVCVGPGGVGKTTSAAAIAFAAARKGHRSLVMTIDPSRRLAQALGVDQLPNTPVAIDLGQSGAAELFAMTPDVKRTFDDLVMAAPLTAAGKRELLDNRFYRRFTESLAGSLEYAAVEKLYEVDRDRRFDLIVLDTPPSQNALDFFDAPARMAAFFGGEALDFLRPGGGGPLRAIVNAGNRVLTKTLGKMAGAEALGELIGLLNAFHGMYAGFRDRSRAVQKLLHSDELGFVLVGRAETPAAVLHGIEQGLEAQGLSPIAIVLNRVCGSGTADERLDISENQGAIVEDFLGLVEQAHWPALRDALEAEFFCGRQTANAMHALETQFPALTTVRLPEVSPGTSPVDTVLTLAEHFS